MINVLLVEDHNVVRNGLKLLLEKDEMIKIVAEAANGREALEIFSSNSHIDLVLSDINMPEMDGIALTLALKELQPHIKIVLLSMLDQESYVFQAFRAGASAYLLKTGSIEELKFAVLHVHSGEQYLCSTLAINLLHTILERGGLTIDGISTGFELSSREAEVLDLIATGSTNEEMSNKLFLSRRTVEGHRQSLLEKFKARNSAELMCCAMRAGFIK